MAKIILTEEGKRKERLAKRMDKFDSVVNEYLRKNRYTTGDLAFQLGIDCSTLWRYRNRPEAFAKAPFVVVTDALRLANCSNETLRYICGLGGSQQ